MSSNGLHKANWASVPGAALFRFITSGSRGWAKHYAEKGSTFIRVGNLNRNSIDLDLDEVQFVEPPKGAEGERTRVRPGDLLISITADIGMVAVAAEGLGAAFVNQHVAIARPKKDIESRYLAWFIASESNGQKQLQALQRGATKLGLGLDDIRSLLFPLPGITTQRRIVAKLEELFSELDAGVAALCRAQRRLARYRQALLQAAVTGELTREWREQQTRDIKLGKLESEWPSGWRQVSVEQLAVQVDYGSSAKTQQGVSGVPVIRMGNIQDGRIVMDDVKTLPSDHPEFPKLLLQPGDLLFNRTNSAELVGKSAVFRGKQPTSFASYLIRVRLNESCIPEWLAVFINSSFGRRWVASVASQQVGQANVNGSKLRALEVPLPTIQEQEAILAELDRRLSAADALEATLQASLRRTERLRQSILERAFRGELVPQDPNDEPAEALLARLKAAAPDTPAPRRRGRPPKAEPAEPQAPRRRGRPRKQVSA